MFRNVLFVLLALLVSGDTVRGAAKRNIVLMVTDDQCRESGCYGSKTVKTPNLDRLAAQGTRFNRAYCTTSSCSASRSVILSGLYNHANGQFGHQQHPHNFHTYQSVRTLPVLLGQAGYRTCSVGKFHVQPESVYHFEVYAKDFRAFLEDRSDPRPFFLYFCTSEPHRRGRGFSGGPISYDPKEIEVPSFLPDFPEVRDELARYYRSVSQADARLGQLLDVLEKTGHIEDTLIIFISDNGMPWPGAKTTLYEPGVHMPLVIRSPDQKRRGGVCNALVTWADLVPTILEYAQVAPPKYPLHGRSFLGILDETDPEGWDEIYLSHTFHEITMYYPMRAVRTRRFKYILNLAHQLPFPFASDLFASATWQAVLERKPEKYGLRSVDTYINRPREELYDLQADPDEVVNLAGKPEYQQVLTELRTKLRAWQEKTKDPWAVKYKYE